MNSDWQPAQAGAQPPKVTTVSKPTLCAISGNPLLCGEREGVLQLQRFMLPCLLTDRFVRVDRQVHAHRCPPRTRLRLQVPRTGLFPPFFVSWSWRLCAPAFCDLHALRAPRCCAPQLCTCCRHGQHRFHIRGRLRFFFCRHLHRGLKRRRAISAS